MAPLANVVRLADALGIRANRPKGDLMEPPLTSCTNSIAYKKAADFGLPLFYLKLNYSPSKTPSISTLMIMRVIKKYCFFVSFSLRNILESKSDTTHTHERMGAAIAPLPLIA